MTRVALCMDGSTRVVCKNNDVIGVHGVLSREVTSFQRLKLFAYMVLFLECDSTVMSGGDELYLWMVVHV